MTQEQFDKLTQDLIYRAKQSGIAFDNEIKATIDDLNKRADVALDNYEYEDYKTLCFFAYQYYRLYYG